MGDATPEPKVLAAGVSGAVATVLIWAATLAGLDLTPEVAAAIATLVAFVAGYFVSNS